MSRVKKNEAKEIISRLEKKKLKVFDIPKEYMDNKEIVTFERKAGLRLTGKRGYDILKDSYFVEEELIYTDKDKSVQSETINSSFSDFCSYYDFLDGDIYNNSCYAFCTIPTDVLQSKNIDVKRLFQRKALIEETIDEYTLSLSEEEATRYQDAERIHKCCKEWVRKFIACNSYDELAKLVSNYQKSNIASDVDIRFFLYQYIFADVEDPQRFSIIMEYMSSNPYRSYHMIKELCSIYNPDKVMQSYHCTYGSKTTKNKNIRKLKEHIDLIKTEMIKYETYGYFDKKTHYFCEERRGNILGDEHTRVTTVYRYFENFDEFITYRNGDLTKCDLSSVHGLDIDLSKCTIDKTTKLPITSDAKVTYFITKRYDGEKFYIHQQWFNLYGGVIKKYSHCFDYFFDFVAFLKGDLSGADLLLCDGIENLKQWNEINFTGALMKSSITQKFGLAYDDYDCNRNLIQTFKCVEKNEAETALILQSSRNNIDANDGAYDPHIQKIHYISDIHLMHRIQNAQCRSKEDVMYIVRKVANCIADEAGKLVLIDGDVSSDFAIFQMFVEELSRVRDKKIVVFTLGNHELWGFPNLTMDDIIAKYRSLLEKHGMYLLQNDLLYYNGGEVICNGENRVHVIKYDELCNMENEKIFDLLRNARYVILGGLGFSGYNTEFNANNGIYRSTIDRAVEVEESKKFESLYYRLYPILSRKNTIIMTHTPKSDWCSKANIDENYIYVSGHTHRNIFSDDGLFRIYADNQIGYHHHESPHLKYFLINYDYDCFDDYADGIHEITQEQYRNFYNGKNLQMTFQRTVYRIHMLKKNGYYCFIHESEGGSLTILNGGAMRKIEQRSLRYYYNNMDAVIAIVREPLDKYTLFQKQIASIVKKIGGTGEIHGCIIDIDFYNHIYVNPFDDTITGYWAADIIRKRVYPSIPALLKDHCPEIYSQYLKLLQGDQESPFALKLQADISVQPQVYLDTDIYKVSRVIKKMQRLNSDILTYWHDNNASENSSVNLE